MLDAGLRTTYRGRAWSKVREWVYFDCVIDLAACRNRYDFADTVVDHMHRGTHDGCEQGFCCEACGDGIMGRHPIAHPSENRFPPS